VLLSGVLLFDTLLPALVLEAFVTAELTIASDPLVEGALTPSEVTLSVVS
jgi:hypothetical protein